MILRDIIELTSDVSTLDLCTDNVRGDTWFFMTDEKSEYNLRKEYTDFEFKDFHDLNFFQNCEVESITASYTGCLRVWINAPKLHEFLSFEDLEKYTFEISVYSKRYDINETFTGTFVDAQRYFNDTKTCLNFVLVQFAFNDKENTFVLKFFDHDDAINYMYN